MSEGLARIVFDFPNEELGKGFAALVNEYNQEIWEKLKKESYSGKLNNVVDLRIDTQEIFQRYVPKFDKLFGCRGAEVLDPKALRGCHADYRDSRLTLNLLGGGNLNRMMDEYVFLLSSFDANEMERSIL